MAILQRFFSVKPRPKAADAAYIALLEAARNRFFFETLSVPDTLDGRFELIILHLVLLQKRLSEIEGSAALAEGLTQAFFDDMERALREMGVLYPDKRLKKMGQAYAGRALAYQTGLQNLEALKSALARNLYGTLHDGDVALLARAAAIVMTLWHTLSAADHATLMDGSYRWADVARIPAAA